LYIIASAAPQERWMAAYLIAAGTVKRHIPNINEMLQVGSRTQAVAAARGHRIL
jgi:ATP/maltotriose-dependent transcriptional regulator MalT